MGPPSSKDIVGKLARGSIWSRLTGPGKKPLRLTAVPRDHVLGDRARGDARQYSSIVRNSPHCHTETAAFSGVWV